MHTSFNMRLIGAVAGALLTSASCTPDGEAFNGEETGAVEDHELTVERTTAALITNNCGDMAGIAASAPWPMKGGCSSHAAQASTHGTLSALLRAARPQSLVHDPWLGVLGWGYLVERCVRTSIVGGAVVSGMGGSPGNRIAEVRKGRTPVAEQVAV